MTAPGRFRRQGPSTLAVHAGAATPEPGAPVVSPLVSSATFYSDADATAEVVYGRYANTEQHQRIGAKLAALEGADAALVVGSGMAAISMAVLVHAGAGGHIVAADSLYGGTLSLMRRDLPRLGIETSFVGRDTGAWASAIRPATRLLYLELPVNPTLRVPDIRPIAALARERGLPLVVDATFATPVLFRPLEWDATMVVHSATKYLGGHSDLVAGVIAGSAGEIETARERLKSFGASLDPHGIWLLDRGIKTLAIRVERQSATALELARWLARHSAISAVHYPGLESHPDHAIAGELMDGYGGMLSFVVRGGDDAAVTAMRGLRLIAAAPSLGGVESLASMPRFTSHAGLSAEARAGAGIDDGFIRLSVGVEDFDDLRDDLDHALGNGR